MFRCAGNRELQDMTKISRQLETRVRNIVQRQTQKPAVGAVGVSGAS